MSGRDPQAATDISAVLIKLKPRWISNGHDHQQTRQPPDLCLAGRPDHGSVVSEIGWFDKILAMVAYLVAVVAAGGILSGLYNTMEERRRDIAILRALGARRRIIFKDYLLESTVITQVVPAFSFTIYAMILKGFDIIRHQTGVVIHLLDASMLWTPPGMILLGALAGPFQP